MRTQAPLHHVREAHPAWFIAPLVTAALALVAAALFVSHEPPVEAAQAATPEATQPATPTAPVRDDAPIVEVPHVQAF